MSAKRGCFRRRYCHHFSWQNSANLPMLGMKDPSLKSLEDMQQIVDRPRSSEERQKIMDDLYATTIYLPEVQPTPACPHDEAGDMTEGEWHRINDEAGDLLDRRKPRCSVPRPSKKTSSPPPRHQTPRRSSARSKWAP